MSEDGSGEPEDRVAPPPPADDPPSDTALPPPGDLVMIDRAVAVVADRVITRSELELSWALATADPGPVLPLHPRGNDPLEWWLQHAVIRELAQEISVYQPSPSEVRARVRQLEEAFEDPADLALLQTRQGLSDDELASWVFSRMVVERYVHRNVGLAAEASRDDDDTYLVRYAAWLARAREQVAIRRVGSRERVESP